MGETLIQKFYLEWGRSRMSLELTSTYVQWWIYLLQKNLFDKASHLESVIQEHAITEWGLGTHVEFDRQLKAAYVVNLEKNRSKILTETK